ncbi:GntR family transcriptional regulator [Streptomyces sp. CB03911]|uniref:GntR family transcriptional regulator n=1 Tax=Streptomyces sp. CB03911 TaxID=1804758 RepID=UPI00093E41A8|nr:GntR family transcriptional regulator [Streptomyces sp. CB03911]OKI19257.1 GntR family transcriptional regulator [Streptomyces sp. CB03911]
MSPGPAKTYTLIADHYRQRILSGELEPGTKLPSNKEICGRWNVAVATVSRALQHLQVEGYLRTSPRGTFVADDPRITASSQERLSRVQRRQSILMDGETSRVTAAELVTPPLYVADLFDLEHGAQLVRREYIAGRGKTRTLFAVSWYPAHFAALCPDLLNTAPGRNDGMTARVLEATGRQITRARDDMHAREASAREASALGIPVGSPTLAMVHRWSDDEGVIEYTEACLPPRFTIGYTYAP